MNIVARLEEFRAEPAQDLGGDFDPGRRGFIDLRRRGRAVFEEVVRLEDKPGRLVSKMFFVEFARGFQRRDGFFVVLGVKSCPPDPIVRLARPGAVGELVQKAGKGVGHCRVAVLFGAEDERLLLEREFPLFGGFGIARKEAVEVGERGFQTLGLLRAPRRLRHRGLLVAQRPLRQRGGGEFMDWVLTHERRERLNGGGVVARLGLRVAQAELEERLGFHRRWKQGIVEGGV